MDMIRRIMLNSDHRMAITDMCKLIQRLIQRGFAVSPKVKLFGYADDDDDAYDYDGDDDHDHDHDDDDDLWNFL